MKNIQTIFGIVAICIMVAIGGYWYNISQDSKEIPDEGESQNMATSGFCGGNIRWNYDESTATLTISGYGTMFDYSYNMSPWYGYGGSMRNLVFINDTSEGHPGITKIGKYAFDYCTGLTGTLTIPDTVTSIEKNAFNYCIGFTSLVIPDSVTSIGDSAFGGCRGLTSLTIGNSVTTIGANVFRGCYGLTGSLVIPDSVTSIGTTAFYDCTGLTGTLTIPDSVTSIGPGAFGRCRGFTSLVIPNSVTTIGSSAFEGCTGLTGALVIPDSVTTLEYNVFKGCTGLTGALTIPDSVTSIGNYAFYDCSGFTGALVIPDLVTSIGEYAFGNCTGFTSLVIPNSVTTIGDKAFYICNSLSTVYDASALNIQKDTNNGYAGYYSNTIFKCNTISVQVNNVTYGSVSTSKLIIIRGNSLIVSGNTISSDVPNQAITAIPNTESPIFAQFSEWENASGSIYEDRTVTAVFQSNTLVIRFFEVDNTQIGDTQYVDGALSPIPAVSIPTVAVKPNLDFQYWVKSGTHTEYIGPDVTSYAFTESVDLVREYNYTLTIKAKNTSGSVVATETLYDGIYTNNMSIPLTATAQFNQVGFRLKGWTATETQPDPDDYTAPTYLLNDNLTIPLSISFKELWAVYQPATLSSINLPVSTLYIKEGRYYTINNSEVTIIESDYQKQCEWYTIENGQEVTDSYYFQLIQNGQKGVRILGKENTGVDVFYAYIRGWKEPWNESAGYVIQQIQIIVTESIPIEFDCRNNDGELYNWKVGYVIKTGQGYVWEDIGDPPVSSYPGDAPERTGFQFGGWTDAEGNTVSLTQVPEYPIKVYATYNPQYTAKDRNTLILQKFSNDGTQMTQCLDMGVVGDLDERFSLSAKPMATPTKSSASTFITDMAVTETIHVTIVRQSPINPNDSSDNSLNWSNAHWLRQVRALVDRWQAETDGIKVLYIPRNMHSVQISGETIYCGDNYDLLGYAKTDSPGLIYTNDQNETRKLVGYNGIITQYTDTYTGGTPRTVKVTMTLQLGGMVAGYEDYAKSLINDGVS